MSYHQKYSWRFLLVYLLLFLMLLVLLARLIDLSIHDRGFLLKQSQARILRKIPIPAHRGMIVDRLGVPLAISTPVESVWVNPKLFKASAEQMHRLARLLNISAAEIESKVMDENSREFIYLKRRLPPPIVDKIAALHIEGLFFQPEYKRYYPEGEVTSHVLGMTNINDAGQEGLELAYNSWLHGENGIRQVVIDRLGHVIEDLSILKKPKQGNALTLSIDHRIQYLSYESLKEAIENYHAQSGSIVVLNVKTGEILAMVNQPSYDPNQLPKKHDDRFRNRAVTDMFEPGSVIKSFDIAFALESGKYKPESLINTNPGWMRIGGYKISDHSNYGVINLTQILQKSSNIGAAKILLSLQPQKYLNLLQRMGFGSQTRSGFPGEASGALDEPTVWYPSVVATRAYGYGMAVTALQLAQAYSILANHGVFVPVTFIKTDAPTQQNSVISSHIADELTQMLESVVSPGGTATSASIPGYHVAGKTGTAYIAGPNGYDHHKYTSSFVGFAPASDPKLVVAVVIHEPQGQHFGGLVSAPVFAKVMSGVLRMLDITPDNFSNAENENHAGK